MPSTSGKSLMERLKSANLAERLWYGSFFCHPLRPSPIEVHYMIEFARHRFGCRILCRLLEHCTTEASTQRLISNILEDPAEALELCRHNFGHHVVQLVLERGHPRHKELVLQVLRRDLATNAAHRRASYVVEAALNNCAPKERPSGDRTRAIVRDFVVQIAPWAVRAANLRDEERYPARWTGWMKQKEQSRMGPWRPHVVRKRGSMPLKLTEVIDRIYKVINDEQQKVKKLLKDIDSIDKPFRERVETALLNAINDIGQKAQHLRPDQARLKSCAPIDPVRDGGSEQSQRVEVAHRFKWLSGTLHLVVRKCWSEDRSEDAKMEIIVQHMDVFLGELEKETALLHRRVQQLDLLLADVFLAMCQPDDLQGRIQEVAREDILTNRFDQETLKELCLDAGRLLWQKVDRENKEQMQTATNLKDLLQLAAGRSSWFGSVMVFLGFIAASLAINIVVLVPVCFGLYSDGDRMKDVYGAETPARGILKAIYTAILLVSSGLFPCIFMAKVGTGAQFMAVGLFVVQNLAAIAA
eukprot:g4166.t1